MALPTPLRLSLCAAVVAACVSCLAVRQAAAGPLNLITNGSFESNTTNGNSYGFTNWTVGGTFGSGPGYGPEVFLTDGKTKGRYGDIVSSDNAVSPDPDPDFGGNYAVYFVDDAARETLSQTVYLAAGTYEVGFDAFALSSGYNNPNNATLSATIAGVSITNASVGAMPKATWEHFAANVTIYASAFYTFTFVYTSGATTAKDVLVDDVYIITPSTLPGFGTYIPEPGSLAVLPAALAVLLLSRRRPRLPNA